MGPHKQTSAGGHNLSDEGRVFLLGLLARGIRKEALE
jgi:hypothetical protein